MPKSKQKISAALTCATAIITSSVVSAGLLALSSTSCAAQGDAVATATAAKATASINAPSGPTENKDQTAAPKKSKRMPFEADLDKIDDVNPCIIKNVTIAGNKLIPRSQIKAVVKVKSGDFYNRAESAKDLQAIYNMGYFTRDDLHIDSEKTGFGLVLNIHVKEHPLVKSFAFTGNKVLSNEQLLAAFKDQLQKPENKQQEKAAIKKILADYQKQGYWLASIRTEMGVIDEYGDDKNVGKVTVTVNEAIVDKIEIKCPTEEQKTIIENALTLKVGDAYNETKLAADLRTAFKSGKFANLTRDVTPYNKDDKHDKHDGYQLTIESKAEEKSPATRTATGHSPLLKAGKANALPVLNKYIKSPMYKNIK